MAFSVTEMISKGLKNGVAKTSNFEVLITPPPALLNYTDIARELIYKADSVEIPGRTTLTIDHKFSNMGPINKIPYSQIYPDVTITFMLSDDFREKMFFDEWQNKMMDTVPAGQGNVFNVKYFKDYVSTVNIRQFDNRGYLRNVTTLYEAYPIIINGIQMGWQQDDIARVSVQMALRYYKVEARNEKVTEESEVPKYVITNEV